MRRRALASALLLAMTPAAPALAAPGRADPAQAAADANAGALLALLDGGCIPNTQGRLPFAADDPRLAAAGLTWLRQPSEGLLATTRVAPGAPSYAAAALPAGAALLTSVPGRICQVTAADTPTGRWTLTRLEALLRAQGGWTLASRHDGIETSRRRWVRTRPAPAGPAADLRYVEFLDGGGPERHTRVILVVQTF